MTAATLDKRNRETKNGACGVRIPPVWPHGRVHAFRCWTGEKTLVTWCGEVADLQDGAEQTRALITCRPCGDASLSACRTEPKVAF